MAAGDRPMSGYCDGCGNTLCVCDQIVQEFIVDTADTVRTQWAQWLVAIGYPYDFYTVPPVPEAMFRPLAEEWYHADDVNPDDGVTVDDYEFTIREEATHR